MTRRTRQTDASNKVALEQYEVDLKVQTEEAERVRAEHCHAGWTRLMKPKKIPQNLLKTWMKSWQRKKVPPIESSEDPPTGIANDSNEEDSKDSRMLR